MRPVLKVVVATSSKNLYPISEHAGSHACSAPGVEGPELWAGYGDPRLRRT